MSPVRWINEAKKEQMDGQALFRGATTYYTNTDNFFPLQALRHPQSLPSKFAVPFVVLDRRRCCCYFDSIYPCHTINFEIRIFILTYVVRLSVRACV